LSLVQLNIYLNLHGAMDYVCPPKVQMLEAWSLVWQCMLRSNGPFKGAYWEVVRFLGTMLLERINVVLAGSWLVPAGVSCYKKSKPGLIASCLLSHHAIFLHTLMPYTTVIQW
jgi:hypothetical protein